MKNKLVLSVFLFLTSLTAFSAELQPVTLKIGSQVTSDQKELLTNAFLYLNKFWADQGKSLSRDVTEKYFDPDTTLIINGKTIYTGYAQFDSHFKEVGKTIRGEIRFPLLEIMSVDNKLIVHFNEDIHDNNGNYYPANVIAIFTLYNGRIKEWEEVVNTNYFCQAESAKVVYSH